MSELVLVGTSDAFGSGGRRQSAYLLRAPSGGVLIDCGQTTGTGLAQIGISRDEIDLILVSHFHADHFGGIPLFLLAALYQDARKHPILIAGPPEIESRVRMAAHALGHPLEGPAWGFPILFQELPAGAERELGPVRVRAFQTRHSPEAHPHGVVLEAEGRRVSYSGDTGWFDELPAAVNGSELLLCECTFVEPCYEYHLSLGELALRREEFDCGRILLTHLGEEMRGRTEHAGFEIADDGRVLKL